MDLYPPIEPNDSGHLDVGDGHSIYWETSGAPTGTPIVWLHGGPGAPASPGTRRYFDPTQYRAVIFDHGRHNISGPLDTAWQLHKAWPASNLIAVQGPQSINAVP